VRYNEACNYVADKAFSLKISNKFQLQKILYRDIRERFGLTAQFAIRIISKVVEAYKRDKTIKSTFRELGSIQYDQRNSRIGIDSVYNDIARTTKACNQNRRISAYKI
jgi:cystathionine beta-lyase family protein involved in aluminum resistance